MSTMLCFALTIFLVFTFAITRYWKPKKWTIVLENGERHPDRFPSLQEARQFATYRAIYSCSGAEVRINHFAKRIHLLTNDVTDAKPHHSVP